MITAGQLRAQGAVIDANIPDHAWVPAHSVHLKPMPGAKGSWTKTEAGHDKYVVTMQATFTEPFTWDGAVKQGTIIF